MLNIILFISLVGSIYICYSEYHPDVLLDCKFVERTSIIFSSNKQEYFETGNVECNYNTTLHNFTLTSSVVDNCKKLENNYIQCPLSNNFNISRNTRMPPQPNIAFFIIVSLLGFIIVSIC